MFWKFIAIFFILVGIGLAQFRVVCYFESWQKRFAPEFIDVNICTHINYAFMGLHENGTLRLDGTDEMLTRVGALKFRNGNLKLLLSIGGWNEGTEVFSRVAADPEKRANMAKSALHYMTTYGYDGVDIDWEYPGKRNGSSPDDKENFINMLQDLRSNFATNQLVTAAVSSVPYEDSYDAPAIAKVVDFMNIMTYDFHGTNEGKTGQNSPLFASSVDSAWQKKNVNCEASVNNWLNATEGRYTDELVMGLAFYGRAFKLKDPEEHGVGAPTLGSGNTGGVYSKVCTLIAKDGWTEVWDEEQQVPCKYKDDQWIGFDNPRSIGLKTQFAVNRHLGGVMMWAVDGDDREGICGTPYALLQAIKKNLEG